MTFTHWISKLKFNLSRKWFILYKILTLLFYECRLQNFIVINLTYIYFHWTRLQLPTPLISGQPKLMIIMLIQEIINKLTKHFVFKCLHHVYCKCWNFFRNALLTFCNYKKSHYHSRVVWTFNLSHFVGAIMFGRIYYTVFLGYTVSMERGGLFSG